MSPCWHLSYLKKCNIVFYHSIPSLLLRTGPTPERTKTTLTTIESDINITTISPIIQRHSTYTKSHRPYTWAWSSSIWYSQSNHHKWDSHITSGKICYSLIEPQLLSSTLAYSHKVHALAFHPHPTFAAPLADPHLKSDLRSVVELFLQKQSTCLGRWLFLQRSFIVDVWQLCLRRFPAPELHKGILNSCHLILLIHTKHKYNKM